MNDSNRGAANLVAFSLMTRRSMLFTVGTVAAMGSGSAHDNDEFINVGPGKPVIVSSQGLPSLRDLKVIHINAGSFFSNEIGQKGALEAQYSRTDLMLKLGRQASTALGLRGQSGDTESQLGEISIYVEIDGGRSGYSSKVTVSLEQQTQLVRNPTIKQRSKTYEARADRYGNDEVLASWMQIVELALARFKSDYIRANRKTF